MGMCLHPATAELLTASEQVVLDLLQRTAQGGGDVLVGQAVKGP
jgi:hypothetical protein